MAYLVYETDNNDTLESIARDYGITSTQLALINNIRMPYNALSILEPGTKLYVPDLQNGRESYENRNNRPEYSKLRNFSKMNDWSYVDSTSSSSGMFGDIGFASQWCCKLVINGGGTIYFPCYPESYSDSHQAAVGSQTPLGRSEPFQIYQNSGPRTVNVSFRMHREMTHVTDIGAIVSAVQACCYPIGTDMTIIPRVELTLANNCYIKGIIKSVSTDWSDTIISGLYMMVTLGFSVEECTGQPKTFADVANDYANIANFRGF